MGKNTCFLCGEQATEDIRLFRFPPDPDRLRQWIESLKIDENSLQRSVYNLMICSLHFKESQIFRGGKRCVLSKWAVPTLKKQTNDKIADPVIVGTTNMEYMETDPLCINNDESASDPLKINAENQVIQQFAAAREVVVLIRKPEAKTQPQEMTREIAIQTENEANNEIVIPAFNPTPVQTTIPYVILLRPDIPTIASPETSSLQATSGVNAVIADQRDIVTAISNQREVVATIADQQEAVAATSAAGKSKELKRLYPANCFAEDDDSPERLRKKLQLLYPTYIELKRQYSMSRKRNARLRKKAEALQRLVESVGQKFCEQTSESENEKDVGSPTLQRNSLKKREN